MIIKVQKDLPSSFLNKDDIINIVNSINQKFNKIKKDRKFNFEISTNVKLDKIQHDLKSSSVGEFFNLDILPMKLSNITIRWMIVDSNEPISSTLTLSRGGSKITISGRDKAWVDSVYDTAKNIMYRKKNSNSLKYKLYGVFSWLSTFYIIVFLAKIYYQNNLPLISYIIFLFFYGMMFLILWDKVGSYFLPYADIEVEKSENKNKLEGYLAEFIIGILVAITAAIVLRPLFGI